MKDVVIVSGKRTPIGKMNGQLKDYTSVDLGTIAANAAINAAGIKPELIDEVIFGNVLQAGGGQNVARQIEMQAKIPETATACTINQVCGSGMKAVRMGQTAIQMGDADIVMVGGTESMSNAPFLNPTERRGHKFGSITMEDSIQKDGLNDAFNGEPMGVTAENVAARFNINRHDQDMFSLSSHQKATKAQRNHYFDEEMIPIKLSDGKMMFKDESVRPRTSLDQLAHLKPVFREKGTVTAGNAASLNDGASALLLMSVEKANELGMQPIAQLDNYAEVGCEPAIMGYAPFFAVQELLKRADKQLAEYDLFELNEAFASQSLAVQRNLGIPDEKLNITGGAVAMGHPLGDSGSRILITLINNLKRTHQKSGIATLCIGGGMGMAMSVHLV